MFVFARFLYWDFSLASRANNSLTNPISVTEYQRFRFNGYLQIFDFRSSTNIPTPQKLSVLSVIFPFQMNSAQTSIKSNSSKFWVRVHQLKCQMNLLGKMMRPLRSKKSVEWPYTRYQMPVVPSRLIQSRRNHWSRSSSSPKIVSSSIQDQDCSYGLGVEPHSKKRAKPWLELKVNIIPINI